MKKSIITVVAVSALLFGMGTSQVFARSNTNNRGNPWGHPMGPNSERNFDPRNSDFQNEGHPMHGMHDGMMGGFDLLGTVSSVDAGKQLVTIKDADGKETQVHVNPFTRIHEFALPEEPQPKNNSRPEINELKLEDLKAGTWVAVKKFKGETKVLEGARILVAKTK